MLPPERIHRVAGVGEVDVDAGDLFGVFQFGYIIVVVTFYGYGLGVLVGYGLAGCVGHGDFQAVVGAGKDYEAVGGSFDECTFEGYALGTSA